jgi:hypothetical protein
MADGSSTTPDTVVLIHGFWVTPRSWEHWKSRYENRRCSLECVGLGEQRVSEKRPRCRPSV